MIDFKYVKNYKHYCNSHAPSGSILSQQLTAGSRITIADSVKEHAGKEGVIIGISGNDVNKLRIKLDDGKKIVITTADVRP